MTYSFTLVLDGPNPNEDANLDRLFEAGCDDATFGARDGVYIADFDRDAPSFHEALTSAIHAVQAAVPGLRVIRIEPEELVSASEIANRVGRSRESVRLLFEGRRGDGTFPRPVTWLQDNTRLWRWTEVCGWFHDSDEAFDKRLWSQEQADGIAAMNSVLTLRDTVSRCSWNSDADSTNWLEGFVLEILDDTPSRELAEAIIWKARDNVRSSQK
jgi:hypothetical protein